MSDPVEPADTDPQAAPGGDGAAAATATRRTTRGRVVRRVANLLLIVGGLTLAFPLWSSAYTSYRQGRLDTALTVSDAQFAVTARAQATTLAHLRSPDVRARYLAGLFAQRLTVGRPIGRLVIPRLGLDRVVTQGASGLHGLSPDADTALLRGGPVHYGVTPLPGAGEPVAIAGHRTTYGAPFYNLDRLRRGDAIVLDTPYGRFTYTVARETVVAPGDTGVLLDRGYALVLTTCTPPYSARQRLIVWADAGAFTLKEGTATD